MHKLKCVHTYITARASRRKQSSKGCWKWTRAHPSAVGPRNGCMRASWGRNGRSETRNGMAGMHVCVYVPTIWMCFTWTSAHVNSPEAKSGGGVLTHACICMREGVYICIHTHTCVCVCVHASCVCVCVRIKPSLFIHICAHLTQKRACGYSQYLHICTHSGTYIHIKKKE